MPAKPAAPTPSRSINQAFRCLDAVARQGSVRKAAEALHLTAAAVHAQVVNLEQQVGAPLFDRLPRGMKLSAAGEIVLAAARRAQRDYEQALSQVEALRSLRRGHVSLGVPTSSAERLLPSVIEATLAQYPGIRFTVRTGNGESLLRGVAGGEIDLALCLERTPPPGVERVRAWPQQLGAVVAPGHELAQRGSGRLRLRDCLAYPLVLPSPDMELRVMAERIAGRERRSLSPVVETASVAMVRRLAAGGSLVGLLVQENVAHDVAEGRLRWLPLADAEAKSRTCLYQRIGQTPAVATGVFVQFLDAELGALMARVAAAVEAV
jgi:DNA-binding transcriptional LysR family regulator